jgi:hypothetical protein
MRFFKVNPYRIYRILCMAGNRLIVDYAAWKKWGAGRESLLIKILRAGPILRFTSPPRHWPSRFPP